MSNTIEHVIGNPNNRHYEDAVGRPLKVGDVIAYSVARSSSVYLNFARIKEFVNTDRPVPIDSKRIDGEWHVTKSWDKAFKLKVQYVEFDPMTLDFHYPKSSTWDGSEWHYEPGTPDNTKTNTIQKVERVLLVDGR